MKKFSIVFVILGLLLTSLVSANYFRHRVMISIITPWQYQEFYALAHPGLFSRWNISDLMQSNRLRLLSAAQVRMQVRIISKEEAAKRRAGQARYPEDAVEYVELSTPFGNSLYFSSKQVVENILLFKQILTPSVLNQMVKTTV